MNQNEPIPEDLQFRAELLKERGTNMQAKTIVAVVIFGLLEALPFRAMIDAILFANMIRFPGYPFVVWGVSLALSGLVSWVYFTKWNARFWIKVAVACLIFVSTFLIFGVLALSIMQRSVINNPPY